MRFHAIALVGLVAMALTAGCSTGGRSEGLQEPTWILSTLDGQSPVVGSVITAVFSTDGKVGGSSGCNSYSAGYQVRGENLTIEPAVSTLMACAEPLMQQESDYLAALSDTRTFDVAVATLTLRDAAGSPRLVFSAQPAGLAGTSWVATGYNNGQGAVVSVMAGTEVTAAFGDNGQVSGSAGCNTYNAAYIVDGDSISVGPAASTRMFCGEPEGVMDQEQQYLAALSTAATYSIRGTQLDLRTTDGALAASFQKVPR